MNISLRYLEKWHDGQRITRGGKRVTRCGARGWLNVKILEATRMNIECNILAHR